MIVAKQKPFEEIYACAQRHHKILLLGCGTCVTVCMAGGQKEVGVLASQIRLAAREHGHDIQVEEHTITRQCDAEFFDDGTARKVADADAVISMGCGVGVQFCGQHYSDKIIYPALDTKFYGATIAQGQWAERCAGCGACIVDEFGGICPIARCSKSLLNGPCGGSQDGRCEVDPEHVECAWQLIYERMEKMNRLEEMETVHSPKDWSRHRDGGPRTIIREDVTL